jgi:hypothetical protein
MFGHRDLCGVYKMPRVIGITSSIDEHMTVSDKD